MTTVAACPTCGAEPLANARFCHGCGSPVEGRDPRAEYKQVTVLFADVVHIPKQPTPQQHSVFRAEKSFRQWIEADPLGGRLTRLDRSR